MMLDYPFREDQIATSPSVPRDNCRLLVVHRREGRWEHRRFHQLASLLRAGDCLVLNTTRVLPARLLGRRASGRGLDLLVLRKLSAMQWEVLGRRLRIGETLCFSEGLKARVLGRGGERSWAVEFSQEEIPQYLQRHGQAPLPPYILKRRNACAQDLRDYQTVYAQVPGSIAAPTAGLHFTEELLEGLRRRGVEIAGVLLHLGWGSFQPLSEQALESGRLSAEYFEVSPEDARRIRETRRAGGRVVAVGT
ncbi:MAG: S-adenosylmethionine:tRNA ribosyltransferase-isomerase, partial [Elusimicrobia bacterium]|nr:S-adenosylmethionine:tRNA ribosyltransferase-isomerase [Elusimicrobiota bacterium]